MNKYLLKTDEYQLAMILVMINEGIAGRTTGFEGFVRNIKKEVNRVDEFYIFDGSAEIKKILSDIRKEILEGSFIETFNNIIFSKVTNGQDNKELKSKVIDFFKNNTHEFEYNVLDNNTMVKPLVPVFQIKGPLWLTLIIETIITNTYNGKTGLNTMNYLIGKGIHSHLTKDEFNYISGVVNEKDKELEIFKEKLTDVAIDFRNSTEKPLFEASFRRAQSLKAAIIASEVAIKNGWDSSSNLAAYLKGTVSIENIGGSMSHSFILSFKTEEDAFIAWDKIFPGTTLLIDTYNVINSAKLIKRLIKEKKISIPKSVRIDSDPIEEYILEIKKILPEIGIFISGDMTIDKLRGYKDYSMSMAGTKYVYSEKIFNKINSGFVYKIVEYIDSKNVKHFPQKKSTGKFNYTGLKEVKYIKKDNVLEVRCNNKDLNSIFSITDTKYINKDTVVIFK